MKISVFGLGYVGAVTTACLARRCNHVVGVDTDLAKLRLIQAGKSPIREEGLEDLIGEMVGQGKMKVTEHAMQAIAQTDMSLICVGTPSREDGSVDTEHVRQVCRQIGSAIKAKGRFHSVVVRSTVVPGTTMETLRPILEAATGGRMGEAFGLSMNPEFLREGASIQDFDQPPFTVIGTDSEQEFCRVSEIYKDLKAEQIHCAVAAAESIKYVCNLFHAAKITFANEIGMMCQCVGVDAREVMEIVCRDTKLNISSHYLRPGFAFGGSCLPKDIRAFQQEGRRASINLPMIEAMLTSNDRQVEKIAERIMSHGMRKISLLGLSFKEGTDDLRESPLVTLAEILIDRGFDLAIYDPNVEYAALFGANKRYIDEELPHLKKILTSAQTAVQHGDLVVFGHRGPEYEGLLASVRPDQHVFDLVGLPDYNNSLGVYEGIYW